MPASNPDVAKVFDEIADLLEILDENTFRIRAYRNAARLIEGLGGSVGEMLARGEDLTELPGIGKDLAGKIREIVATGTCAAREALREKLPATITTLLKIPGLGPKRVQALYRQLDISTPEQLYAAVQEGKVRELPGFGEKTEASLLQALGHAAPADARVPLAVAARHAEPLRAYLAQTAGVDEVVIAGSYRRYRETVGDIDIVVTAKHSGPVMQRFCDYPQVAQVRSKGDTRATVVLAGGLQVDMRVVPQASFGAALYYFTGSKTHNVAVRRIAQQRGLKINEYGVFRGKRRIAGATEQSVFDAVGLPYIAPELRENRGEIEAAQAGKLPVLVTLEMLKGDLHVRAPLDDDAALQRLIAAARTRGMRYLALTLRSSETTPKQLHRWLETIDRRNKTLRNFVLLKAIALDIPENGALEVPDAAVDLVIGEVRDLYTLPRRQQTARLLRAMEHPRFTLLAHPTGRLLGQRAPLDIDMPRVIRAARERGCLLEVNAEPERLDLPDVYCRLAKEEGVLLAINSGAHDAKDFDNLRYGLGQARRGWVEARNVANTRPLAELRKLLKATRLSK